LEGVLRADRGLEGEEGKLAADEQLDIITNYLACHASLPPSESQIKEVEQFMSEFGSANDGQDSQKSYEYYFNLAQIYLVN